MTKGSVLCALVLLAGCAAQAPVTTTEPSTQPRVRVVQRGMGSGIEFVACTECASATKKVIDLPAPQVAKRAPTRPTPLVESQQSSADPVRRTFAVHFDVGSAKLDQQANVELAAAASALKDAAGTVSILGRTDPTGPEKLNSTLALKRAEAVRDALRDAGWGSIAITVGRREPCCDGERKASAEVHRSLRRADVEIVFRPKG